MTLANEMADILEARLLVTEGNLERARELVSHKFSTVRGQRRVREIRVAIKKQLQERES